MKKLLVALLAVAMFFTAYGCVREYMVPIMIEGDSNTVTIETNANVPKVITVSPKIDIPVDVIPGIPGATGSTGATMNGLIIQEVK